MFRLAQFFALSTPQTPPLWCSAQAARIREGLNE
jgi:hypothetical protein